MRLLCLWSLVILALTGCTTRRGEVKAWPFYVRHGSEEAKHVKETIAWPFFQRSYRGDLDAIRGRVAYENFPDWKNDVERKRAFLEKRNARDMALVADDGDKEPSDSVLTATLQGVAEPFARISSVRAQRRLENRKFKLKNLETERLKKEKVAAGRSWSVLFGGLGLSSRSAGGTDNVPELADGDAASRRFGYFYCAEAAFPLLLTTTDVDMSVFDIDSRRKLHAAKTSDYGLLCGIFGWKSVQSDDQTVGGNFRFLWRFFRSEWNWKGLQKLDVCFIPVVRR